jgi:hypothetical protein
MITGTRFRLRATGFFCVLLIARMAAAASPAPPAQVQSNDPKGKLQVVIIQGNYGKHNIRTKTGVQTVVEVRNEANEPQPGVRVYFQLPNSGPGGSFAGENYHVTITNAQGQAGTSGFIPNDIEGSFNLKVTATKERESVTVLVPQANVTAIEEVVSPKRRSRKGLWTLVAVGIGAGATVGILLLTRNSDPASVTPGAVTVIPGPISVGNPR